MGNKKGKDILSVEILYDYKEELDELVGSQEFNQLILNEAIDTIKIALTDNKKTAKVLYIPNLGCSVTIEKQNFPKVLDTAIKFYESQEDYTKCAQLVSLKKRINGPEKRNKRGN